MQLNAEDILKCYDTFEWLVERLSDIMQSVFYRVSQIDDALRISVHIVSEADLRGLMSERPELKCSRKMKTNGLSDVSSSEREAEDDQFCGMQYGNAGFSDDSS